MRIYYGTEKNRIDITHVALDKFRQNDYLNITSNNEICDSLFSDPCLGQHKFIFVKDNFDNVQKIDGELVIHLTNENYSGGQIHADNSQMVCIYRISDGGYNKVKPSYITKRTCFLHFLKIFEGHEIQVVADNVSDDTFQFLLGFIDPCRIHRTYFGHGAGSFKFGVDLAIRLFARDTKVYFAEDDYVYVPHAPKIISEGLDIADYSSGYDHWDKYINNGPNPFVHHGGEETRVIVSASHHWKYTNSCCMTFGVRVGTMVGDYDIYQEFNSGTHPHDFQMFCALRDRHHRRLVSSIPGVSTHGEVAWLSPFVDWEACIKISI